MLAILLAVVAIAPACLISYYYTKSTPVERPIASVDFEPERPQKLEIGTKYEVKACKVLDGYRFEMYLEGGKWIEAHLRTATKDDATNVVVELLNKTTPPAPTVTLIRQTKHYWIVDMELTVEGKRVDLTELLRSKGLIL
jgi:hypothetical protein